MGRRDHDNWILTADHEVVQVGWDEWAEWIGQCQTEEGFERYRRVDLTHIDSDCRVSTVFLSINHRFGLGPPLLFETMVFGGEYNDHCDRYSTWVEAVQGHRQIVAMVLGVPVQGV